MATISTPKPNPTAKLGKRNTSMIFDDDVVAYLDKLAAASGKTRTWVLHAAIREHAKLTKEKLGESGLLFNPKDLIIQF